MKSRHYLFLFLFMICMDSCYFLLYVDAIQNKRLKKQIQLNNQPAGSNCSIFRTNFLLLYLQINTAEL